MRMSEGPELDDALELFHNHQWQAYKPVISAEQMAELIPVLAPLFQQSRPRVRPKQKVRTRPRPKVDKGSEHRGRRLVGTRSGGLCEVGVDGICTGVAREWQHRKNRSQQGTWHASNGLHACSPCHQWIHANPSEATFHGWTVPSWGEPERTVVFRRGEWVLLKDDGTFEPYEGKVA